MTRKRFSLSLLAALVACGDDATEGPDLVEQPVLYAVQHNINAPDGRLVYINLIPSLDAPGAAIDTSNAIELSGYAAMQSFDGALFVAENESRTITRYEIDAYGRPTEAGRLSFAAEEVDTFWNENFLYVDSNTAWYANSAAGEILIWDPTAMEIRDRIVVEGMDSISALPFDFEGFVRVEDRVFMPLSFLDWDAYEAEPNIAVAVFSVSEDRLLGIWEDTRCALPMSSLPHMSVATDGTLYLAGDSGWGAWNHGALPAIEGTCAVRILPAADGFDPEWTATTHDAVEGYEGMMSLVVD
ncbi:MAG: hypothetical protein MUE69_14340, partial [Myxococcota bacterium]|nr:hypothetical protein [Myxococcota bacterium]